MSALDDFNETVGRLTSAMDAVSRATDTITLSRKESEAVNTLQLLEVQIGAIGQDLYHAVRARHTKIMRGEIEEETNENSKRSNSGRAKRQSNSKAKRASK